MHHGSTRRWWVGAGCALASAALQSTAGAQHCTTTSSRVGLSAYADARIRSLRIETSRPESPPGLAGLLDRFHVATRAGTVRRELLFAEGDAVDTVAVAESLRRLRAVGYLGDVRIDARTCPDSNGVALTVVTRDARSERPIVKVRPSAVSLGFSETNTLGTGRAVLFAMQTGSDGVAGTAIVRDPTLFGERAVAQLGSARYVDGASWFLDLQSRRRDVADPWTVDVQASLSERELVRGVGTALDRVRLSLLAGHRVSRASAATTTYLLGGVERERADVAWSRREPIVGPADVRRRFIGVDVGVARRAARFDTLAWLLPRDGIVDVPRGTEMQLVIAPGHDRADGRSKAHVDAWTGRAWKLGAGALAVGDVWAAGYLGDAGGRRAQAASLRASLAAVATAPHGLWRAGVAAERLLDPDPTVRALASVDPTAALLPREARLAAAAVAGSVERTRRLRPITRSTALDAALFGAASYRWDPASPTSGERLGAAFLGAGLRVVPTHVPQATVRLDVGYPVWRTPDVRARPMVGLSITPWLLADRQREGSRVP